MLGVANWGALARESGEGEILGHEGRRAWVWRGSRARRRSKDRKRGGKGCKRLRRRMGETALEQAASEDVNRKGEVA